MHTRYMQVTCQYLENYLTSPVSIPKLRFSLLDTGKPWENIFPVCKFVLIR